MFSDELCALFHAIGRAGKLCKLPRWITGNHYVWRHVHHDDGASRHYTALSYGDARHNDSSFADPNVIFDYHRPDFFVRGRRTGHARYGIQWMPGRIENHHLPGNSTVPANDNFLRDR